MSTASDRSDRSTRPDPSEHLAYYGKYIALVPDGDIVATLERELETTLALLRSVTPAQAEHRYAPGKWSVKEVVGHIIDAERIFAYRTLRFARNDQTPLAGFEENDYVPAGQFGDAPSELAAEFDHVRQANLFLFRHLPDAAWAQRDGERRGGERAGPGLHHGRS